jgi:hypothetical protein
MNDLGVFLSALCASVADLFDLHARPSMPLRLFSYIAVLLLICGCAEPLPNDSFAAIDQQARQELVRKMPGWKGQALGRTLVRDRGEEWEVTWLETRAANLSRAPTVRLEKETLRFVGVRVEQ